MAHAGRPLTGMPNGLLIMVDYVGGDFSQTASVQTAISFSAKSWMDHRGRLSNTISVFNI